MVDAGARFVDLTHELLYTGYVAFLDGAKESYIDRRFNDFGGRVKPLVSDGQ